MESDGSSSRHGEPAEGAPGRHVLSEEEAETLRRRLQDAVAYACPDWMADQAEDIVHNVFIQLLRTVRKSEGERHFSSIYLARAAHGATVDEIRRRCRRKEHPADAEGTMEKAHAHNPSPELESAMRELGRGIQDCLARMLRSRRLVVTLYLHGCTVPETARRLHWSPKKTENLVYRGLKDLRRCLTGKGVAP